MNNAASGFIDHVAALLAGVAADQPVVMINLLRYRDHALYPPGFAADPCRGSDAYARYSRDAIRFVHAVGGQVVWRGSAKTVVIGPATERWDDALLVQYPSKQAFLDMIGNPGYQAITVHRTAALEDSRLIATVPATP
jgi:uncharacterized protein (DUF1330 family)